MNDWDAVMRDMLRACAKHEIAVMEHVDQLKEELVKNPKQAIENIVATYNHALDDAYTKDGYNWRGFVEAMAGGPAECVPHAVYNAVGAIYPHLAREDKTHALRKILSILDRINYVYVNTTHTPGIREPLLLSDITIARPIYWPGLEEGKSAVQAYVSFSELKENIIDKDGFFNPRKVKSDFVVAYSLLRSDFCCFGEEYVQAAPGEFLHRVMQGIVGLRFSRCSNEEDRKQRTARLRELLPPSLHNKIEQLRDEQNWVDYRELIKI